MVADTLSRVFSALADPTRRSIVARLAEGDATVNQLAEPYRMTLQAVYKHLRVLEDAGLIERTKEGRVVSCELDAAPLKAASAWMTRYEKFWIEKLDSLARYLYQQEELQIWNKQPGKNPSSTSFAPTQSRPRKSGGRGPTRKR